MRSRATDREQLIAIAKATLDAFHRGQASLEAVGDVHPDATTSALSAALDWARLDAQASESSLKEEQIAAPQAAEPYIPSNQILSLLQSAYDEYMESQGITEVPFDPSDSRWATIAQEKLTAASRGKHPFVKHTTPAGGQPTPSTLAMSTSPERPKTRKSISSM
jgi:hypothetical protein